MVSIIIEPPGLFGTEGDDRRIFQAEPPLLGEPAAIDVIAIDVLTDATVDLLAGNDSFTGGAATLAVYKANAIGIRNRGDFLGNSGNDTLTGIGVIIKSTDDLGRFSVGISNSGSQALFSGGEDNDRIQGIALGGVSAIGIQNTGVISGDEGSDAISGIAQSGFVNLGMFNNGEISGGVGDDTITGEAISTLSLNDGILNTGILNQGKIYGDDPNSSDMDGNDVLIGKADGGIVGEEVIGISNQLNPVSLESGLIDMGGGARYVNRYSKRRHRGKLCCRHPKFPRKHN